MTVKVLRRLGFAALTAAAFTLPVASAQDRNNNQDRNDQNRTEERRDANQERDANQDRQKTERKKRTLKVFELKHRNPQEIIQVLTLKWTRADQTGFGQPGQPFYGTQQASYPVRPGVPTPVTTQAQPATTEHVAGYRGTESELYVTFDAEAGLMFVRGTEDRVKKVEELIKAIDVSKDELQKASFEGLHLIPVKQDKLQQVTRTLSMLRIANQPMVLGDVAIIVVRDDADEDDDVVDQVREIVSKYDAARADANDRNDRNNNRNDNNNNRNDNNNNRNDG
jgi:Ni/Co efflux regulator RcnB